MVVAIIIPRRGDDWLWLISQVRELFSFAAPGQYGNERYAEHRHDKTNKADCDGVHHRPP